MKINNKEELQNFLENNINEIGGYFLVTYNNKTEPIWFTKYKKWSNNKDWFLEAPCELYEHDMNIDECFGLIEDLGLKIVGKKVYEIECPQISPFLPEVLDDIEKITEDECYKWLIKK